jgi:hypothetical protein
MLLSRLSIFDVVLAVMVPNAAYRDSLGSPSARLVYSTAPDAGEPRKMTWPILMFAAVNTPRSSSSSLIGGEGVGVSISGGGGGGGGVSFSCRLLYDGVDDE